MNYNASNERCLIIEIEIPPWYPQRNAFDIYQYLLTYPNVRQFLFDKVDQAHLQLFTVVFITHPLIFLPFYFCASTDDATFVRILEGRIASPSIEDLYQV